MDDIGRSPRTNIIAKYEDAVRFSDRGCEFYYNWVNFAKNSRLNNIQQADLQFCCDPGDGGVGVVWIRWEEGNEEGIPSKPMAMTPAGRFERECYTVIRY